LIERRSDYLKAVYQIALIMISYRQLLSVNAIRVQNFCRPSSTSLANHFDYKAYFSCCLLSGYD